jgi:signal transduction histidine kinase
MSIRKSMFLSNAAMIMIPVVLFALYFILLSVVFSGDIKVFSQNFHRGWQTQPAGPESQLFNSLKKTASLKSEEFFDKEYLSSLTSQLDQKSVGILIRKDDGLLYASDLVNNLKNKELPKFGNEGYSPNAWIGGHPYTLRQHDFYFADGGEGSILLLDSEGQFTQFARRFFPLIFIGLILIVIFTNAILSYFMARRILKPIHQLSSAAVKISEGQFDFQIKPASKDELGKLVKSFDEMRGKLADATKLREQYENNRKELIANISHDLKTPITSIRGYVEGIKDGVANTEEKLNRYLDTIHVKAKHMDHLIDELFLFSKLDVESIPFHYENVALKSFLEDYLEEMGPELKKENVQISFHSNRIHHQNVILDRDKMIRVLNNIIYNSMKYRDKDVCRIGISLEDQGDKIKVAIQDNGPGVAAEELSDIFNRFYRGDPSRNSKTGGSGLGLAISKQIIKAHGGDVWANSLPGEGLGIYFTLRKQEDKGDDHE